MSASRRQLTAFALLGLVMVLWAGNSIVGRAVRFDVPPLTLAFVRWFGASLLLSPFALSHVRRDWAAIREGWKAIVLLGLLGVGAFNAFLYAGLRYTTATNALLLQAAIPAMVMVLDRLFFSVRSAGLQKLGVACSIFGVAVVVFEGDLARALGLRFGAALGKPESDVARAAGHVEDRLPRLRLHAADEAVLPQAVHAAGHRVVHHVVLRGDAGEHRTDAPRLLLGIDALVAERYLIAHARSSSGATFGAPALACPRRVRIDRPIPSRISIIPMK